MPLPDPSSLFDAERMSSSRTAMPTSLDTAGLRDLGADVLARSVFTARGTNAIFTSKLKEVVDLMASGKMSEGQVRTALWETLKATGYTPEGGFPDAPPGEVPPAVKGTLQDLSSFRRLDLIVSTQRKLMQGAGELWRAMQPESLAAYPAFELIRTGEVEVARDWESRWTIAGFPEVAAEFRGAYKVIDRPTGMIGLVGDPRWGELGSYENFPDALGVDHYPFYFRSEVGWRLVSMQRCLDMGITGPDGETPQEWIAKGGAVTLAGKMPPVLPRPRISLDDVDPAMIEKFKAMTHATPAPGKPYVVDFSDILSGEFRKGGAQ